jgi:hypothetical protein
LGKHGCTFLGDVFNKFGDRFGRFFGGWSKSVDVVYRLIVSIKT